MPQDSLRSVVYRSFVTCDDPKGVVECRAIRKSKSGSQKMEGRIESRRTQKNLNASSTYKEESKKMGSKGTAEELHNPSSFQLMEVSKGAQKLNRVIDSWSKGMTFDGHSKDIAKDLLKGALDLQDSLIMLGKLQEASQYMAKLKKKQKEISGGRRIDEMGSERTNSNRFGDQNYQTGFQKPRLSADGSSRDCFEELRQVIRDSLARQNLLPNSYTEEKAYCDRRTSDSALDIPSTSSSQSSEDRFHRFASSECSLSSKAPQKKPSGPNLIAKLMGLEQIRSKPLQSTLQKQLESDKISNQRRPISDIDMPKARKPQSVVQKVDPERGTLKEILETMQFKGLLKSNSVEGFKPPSHHPNASHSEERSIDGAPPIVIIKALRPSGLEAEERHTQMFIREEGALDAKEMFRKLKIKEELPPKAIDHRERVLNSKEMCRNREAEEPPIRRLGQEEEAKDCKEVLTKQGKEVKTKEKLSSNKMKAPVPVNQKAQKEAIERNVDKIQKVTPNRRKPVETENVKLKGISKSHEQGKVTSTKLKNAGERSNIMKSQIVQHKTYSSNPISKRTTPTISRSSTHRKKNSKHVKPIREPLAATLAAENIGSKDDSKGFNTMPENEFDLIRADTASADQHLTEECTDASEIQIKDHCNDSQYSLCEATLQTIQHESGIKSAAEANYCISHNSTEKKLFTPKTNTKDLLLSNPSFLSRAEELFDINVDQPTLVQTVSANDSAVADTRLLLDSANELMELERLRCTRTVHPFLQIPMWNSRFCISLDQLAEEVCYGIENLRSYSKVGGENLFTDSLYAVLERDLRCKGVVSGAWDLGWRNGYAMNEVEQVVGDLEKLLLSRMIEEVLTDFVL